MEAGISPDLPSETQTANPALSQGSGPATHGTMHAPFQHAPQGAPQTMHPGFEASPQQPARVHPGFSTGNIQRVHPSVQTPGPYAQPTRATPPSPLTQAPSWSGQASPQAYATPRPIQEARTGFAASRQNVPLGYGLETAGVHTRQAPSLEFGPGQIQGPSGEGLVRTPPMDVFDEGETLVMKFELPGISKKDIKLVGRDDGIFLEAISEAVDEEQTPLTTESGERVFKRQVPLGIEILPDEINASFRNGILEVTIPKKEPTTGPKNVEIS